MLNLALRRLVLDPESSTKSKEDDGAEAKITVLGFSDYMLEPKEVNLILGDPYAYNSLFNDVNGVLTPYLKCVKALELIGTIQPVYARFVYGLTKREVEFKTGKMSKIKLELRDHGEVAMHGKIAGRAALDATFGDFISFLGDSMECELRFEPPGQQQDLPLNSVGANESNVSSIGTAAQEREKARQRDREINAEAQGAHVGKGTEVKRQRVNVTGRGKKPDPESSQLN